MARLMAAAALLVMSGMTGAAAMAGQPSPVVLELFTSQGCSSCPPADALLGRLLHDAEGAGLLPLSLHVDYWNRIGWRDPYSSPAMTDRQYEYARSLGQDGVYTPELVVDGAEGVVGSDAASVRGAIGRARAVRAGAAPIPLSAAAEAAGGGRITVRVGAGAGQGRLLLVGYDDRHVTRIGSGENEGRTLIEFNVVRSLQTLGQWSGQAATFAAAPPAGERAAVLLQSADGRILAADMVAPPPAS
jgi:hypothetical protein